MGLFSDEPLRALRIFQAEVELQCKLIVTAAHHLNAAIGSGNTDEIWKQLQIILIASANLSKMFWGSCGRRESERAPLRDSLQVDDGSPLRDPDLRNDFEHFDERLETWYADSEHRNYVGRNIGPPNMIVGPDPSERFSALRSSQRRRHFLGAFFQCARRAARSSPFSRPKRLLPTSERYFQCRFPFWY